MHASSLRYNGSSLYHQFLYYHSSTLVFISLLSSPRPQCKISLQHPLHDYSRNISADSVKQKRSLGGLADHENLRSKSISNLDTVIAGTSPDPVLSEMRIGSAPTSPKSNTPTPTSSPLMSSVPLIHHRKEPTFSQGEPSNTMLLR